MHYLLTNYLIIYFSMLILTVSGHVTLDLQQKGFKTNPNTVKVHNLFTPSSIYKKSIYSTPSRRGTPLYSLTGELFKKPLLIRQWAKYPEKLKSAIASKNPIDHRFIKFSDSMVYIEQYAAYVGYSDCRIFNTSSQVLFKPVDCISSGVMHTSFELIDKNLLIIYGNSEGGGHFSVASYSDKGKQTNHLYVSLPMTVLLKIQGYRKGILSFSTNCNVTKKCAYGKDYDKKLVFHYEWSKSTGLIRK